MQKRIVDVKKHRKKIQPSYFRIKCFLFTVLMLFCKESVFSEDIRTAAPSEIVRSVGEQKKIMKEASLPSRDILGVNRSAVDLGLNFFRSRLIADAPLGDGAYRNSPAITALVGMAFLASGSTPQEGPDAVHIRKCISRLLALMQENGFISLRGSSGQGPMYGHGFSVTFLSECYGMTDTPGLREKLQKAVKVIIESQNEEGGWRYEPRRNEADVSVTACMVVALRAAHNASIYVPSEVVTRAVDYVKKCQNTDGGFRYRSVDGPSAFPRSAAALMALYSSGAYDGEHQEKALKYFSTFNSEQESGNKNNVEDLDGYFPYAQYYAMQALWLAPGEKWKHWYTVQSARIIRSQRRDGSWSSSISVDAATAMILIMLQVPNNYLPVLQR